MSSTLISPGTIRSNITDPSVFDVIIIGGSFAGLSAALALGRARRTVLVIDAGEPCNHMVKEAHNFITHDGDDPNLLRARAKDELTHYDTVRVIAGSVDRVSGSDGAFRVSMDEQVLLGRRILLATGVKDLSPPIPGLAECWGTSVLHCPFCHGYEVRDSALGVLGSGAVGFEFARTIRNWSRKLILLTNGPSELTTEHADELTAHDVMVIEDPIAQLVHHDGQLTHVEFTNGRRMELKALFARLPFSIPQEIVLPLGCTLTDSGHVQVDGLNRTNVAGVFAAGDLTSPMRSLAAAIASGNIAGASITHSLVSQWQ